MNSKSQPSPAERSNLNQNDKGAPKLSAIYISNLGNDDDKKTDKENSQQKPVSYTSHHLHCLVNQRVNSFLIKQMARYLEISTWYGDYCKKELDVARLIECPRRWRLSKFQLMQLRKIHAISQVSQV